MPYLVNGQVVTEQVIGEEHQRIARDPQWQTITDEAERARNMRAAAEASAVDRTLIEQLAESDPRPIDPALVEKELDRLKTQSGVRSGFDDAFVRPRLERDLRVRRIGSELIADSPKPSLEDVEAFYHANAPNFHQPELFKAAHIVKYVNRGQSREQALAGMEIALAELERGDPFAEVAGRHSDCSDKGGDLGEFPAGHMVEEFEREISSVEPGQRTGIFETGFGLHIALLNARTPAGQASLERVRADIERVMTYQNQHETYFRKIGELRSRAYIRFVPEQRSAAG